MDYGTLINNFIEGKIMRGKSIPERSYGNMSYSRNILYSYSHPLVVRQDGTGTYFINTDAVSRTTGRHISHTLSSFRFNKIPLIEISGGALEGILGLRTAWGWSGRYFDTAINNIELVESDDIANNIARLPENCIYGFSKKQNENKEPIVEYYTVDGKKYNISTPVAGMWFHNQNINLKCNKLKLYSTPERIEKMEFDDIPAIEELIDMLEQHGWHYEGAKYLHKSSSLVFRSKYRQFESLFNNDNGYSNETKDKKWYYYYGGFDERQYFIAALPREVTGINDALQSLKPQEVIAYEQESNDKAFRQGEWFFVPSYDKIPKSRFTSGALPDDGRKTNEHVCKYYKANDGTIYVQDTTVYHRNTNGRSSGEHKKLKLIGQYKAYKNTELDSRSSFGKVD